MSIIYSTYVMSYLAMSKTFFLFILLKYNSGKLLHFMGEAQ